VNKTKVIIAGVALVAALGVFIMVGSGEEAIPDTDDTRTQWICLACQKSFTLTAAEFDTASQSSGKSFLVKCPECSDLKGVRAAQCAGCQNQFALTNADGEDTPCTKCQPATVKSLAAPEAETPVEETAPVEESAPADRPVMFVQ